MCAPALRSFLQLSVVMFLLAMAGCSRDGADPEGTAGTGSGESAEFDEIPTPPPASSDETQSSNTDPFRGGDAQASRNNKDAKSPAPAKRPAKPRTSLEGRWDVVLHDYGTNYVGMLIDVTRTGDGHQVEQIGESPLGWSLSGSQVEANAIDLTMSGPADSELSFQGTFRDGKIQGSLLLDSQGIFLASLEPTTREHLGREIIREPAAGIERLRTVRQDENAFRNLVKIADESSSLPLAYQLYNRLFNVVRSQPQQEFELQGPIDNYLAAAQPWGERVTSRVHLDIGYTLAVLGQSPEQALEHLDQAAEGLEGQASESLLSQLELSRGLALLELSDEQRQQEGVAVLQKVREQNPYNLLAISRLADYHLEKGELQAAMERHAELVALPSVPGDAQALERLWAELGKDPQELDAYLDEVYQRLVFEIVEEDAGVEAIEKQQVVLGELFTGATCPPCVAADIATGALEQTYPATRFLMLRYHQHIPGPDPLTVADGEERGHYYSIPGTPSCFLNGSPIQGVGGSFFNSLSLYQSLKSVVAPLLAQTTDLAIDLAAQLEGETIRLRVKVNGAETYPDSWRLRLCLVESHLPYPAPNGIRLHEMVVRAMPGGAEGIVAANGGLSYEADFPLADIHASIQDGVAAAHQRSGGRLPALPGTMGPLNLVAFVQDDVSFEILQAASVPVAGAENLPAPATQPAPAAEPAPDTEPTDPPVEQAPNTDPATPATNDVNPEG